MTRYQTILSLGNAFTVLIGKGIIPVHLLDWKVYYEAYLAQKELEEKKATRKKTEAVETVAVHYDISRRHLFQIIKYMESI